MYAFAIRRSSTNSQTAFLPLQTVCEKTRENNEKRVTAFSTLLYVSILRYLHYPSMLSTFLRGRNRRYASARSNLCSFLLGDPVVTNDVSSGVLTGKKYTRGTSYENKPPFHRNPSAFPIRPLTTDTANTFIHDYEVHVQERAALKIAPKPLGATQVASLTQLLEYPPNNHAEF